MEKEKFAENYYRSAAKKMKNEGLQRICILLAEEEVQHYKWIEKMKSQQPDVVESDVLSKSKEIFAGMKESKDTFGICESQIELFEKAQEFEQNSKSYYEEKAKQVDDPKQKEIFAQLAQQENKHFILLENVIEFLKKPEFWLENAEFYHIDEF
jgi:rubrerythrin